MLRYLGPTRRYSAPGVRGGPAPLKPQPQKRAALRVVATVSLQDPAAAEGRYRFGGTIAQRQTQSPGESGESNPPSRRSVHSCLLTPKADHRELGTAEHHEPAPLLGVRPAARPAAPGSPGIARSAAAPRRSAVSASPRPGAGRISVSAAAVASPPGSPGYGHWCCGPVPAAAAGPAAAGVRGRLLSTAAAAAVPERTCGPGGISRAPGGPGTRVRTIPAPSAGTGPADPGGVSLRPTAGGTASLCSIRRRRAPGICSPRVRPAGAAFDRAVPGVLRSAVLHGRCSVSASATDNDVRARP